MKVIPGFIAALALSGTISLTAAAAEQPITVLVDQQKLNLATSAPVMDQETVLVPMRPILQKLGMDLIWDAKTKTVTATKDGLTIKLQIGSKRATVNGTVKQLKAAPKSINNVTYIPLRFVGEATGNEVKWNAKTRIVEINRSALTIDTSGIDTLFKNYVLYSDNENLDGFMSLIDPSSALAGIGDSVKGQMELYDTKTTIDDIKIVDAKANEATVTTTETTKKIGGAFMLDSKTENTYLLTKPASSKIWLINNVQVGNVEYSLPQGALDAVVTVPKEDETKIKAALQANADYSNKEDLNGVLSTIDDSSPIYDQTKQTYAQIFKAYDLDNAVESTKILDYTGTEAYVYTVQTTKRLSGPEFTDNRAFTVNALVKADDGSWKITETYILGYEALAK